MDRHCSLQYCHQPLQIYRIYYNRNSLYLLCLFNTFPTPPRPIGETLSIGLFASADGFVINSTKLKLLKLRLQIKFYIPGVSLAGATNLVFPCSYIKDTCVVFVFNRMDITLNENLNFTMNNYLENITTTVENNR